MNAALLPHVPLGRLFGLIEVMAGLFIAPAFKYVAVFAIYLVVVLIRPQGLFGKFG